MEKPFSKPILFLDFDYTLFDTKQLRAWLGDNIASRIQAISLGTLELPDVASMLYHDTLSFLKRARKTHQLVLLTCAINPAYQEKKIYRSGVAPYLDDMLIPESTKEASGKGAVAKEYLRRKDSASTGHFFVDDLPENIS